MTREWAEKPRAARRATFPTFVLLAASLAALLAGGCSGPEKDPEPRGATPGAAVSPLPFLWEVRSETSCVHLLGTTNLRTPIAGALPEVVWARLDASPLFVTIADVRGVEVEAMRSYSLLPPPRSLDDMLPAESWQSLVRSLEGTVTEEGLRRLQPWFAVTLIRAGLTPGEIPMELELLAYAEQRGKPIRALERWQVQAVALSRSLEVKDLERTIAAQETLAKELESVALAYESGDLEELIQLTQAPARMQENPRYRELYFHARNRAWLPVIEELVTAESGAFIAVKIGHLLGEQGLLRLLEERGYRVTRVGDRAAPSGE